MTSIENRQRYYKIVTSVPVASVLYGVPFALLMTVGRSGHFSWMPFAIISVGFGVPMAIIMKRKFGKMFGSFLSSQDYILAEHFKKGTLPLDPKLVKAMPEYIDKLEQLSAQSKRSFPKVLALGAGGLLFSFLQESRMLWLLSVFILGMAIFSYFSLVKTDQKIMRMRERLREKPSE